MRVRPVARRRLAWLVAFGLVATTLAACADVVDGTGTNGVSSEPSGDFPSQSGSAPPTDASTGSTEGPTDVPTEPTDVPTDTGTTGPTGSSYRCPTAVFPEAGLSFRCLTSGMTLNTSGKVYPRTLALTVEPSTGWQLESGAKPYTGTYTDTGGIAADVRNDQLEAGNYGENPVNNIDSVGDVTVDGQPGYYVIDNVKLNVAWAQQNKTKVRVERRWTVIIKLPTGKYTIFYASIPDIAKQYWPAVQGVIDSIKLTS